MSSPPLSSAAPFSARSQASPAVAVAILADDGIDPQGTLQALRSQVYAPTQTLVVGGPKREGGVRNSSEVIGALAPGVSFVWWVHGDTRPRPDALGGLVREIERTEAAVAGSKILVDGGSDRLESVGGATDVYGDIYTGLDPDELDLEQYDVVREVSYVSAVSLLVRRDLLRGLGGFDPSLAPQAASIDFCQRVRLAGGRVVVVPSSEVFHQSPCAAEAPGWKEQGGRNKAMLVAYSLLTLAWVVPMGALVGLLDGLSQLVLGRVRPLLATLVSWLWTLAQVPSVIVARARLRRIRVVGDEELFRFQVSGSSRLRRTFSEIGDRFNAAIDEDEAGSLAERARIVWRRPSAGLSTISALAVLVATRSIWFSGPPQVGFALPAGLSGFGAAYGGGPNPAGFGSDLVVPPVVGLGSIAFLLLGRRPNLGSALLLLVAIALALLGMARLARRMGAGSLGAFVAGWVYVAGATTAAVAATANWPALLAIGPLPWAIEAVVAPSVQGRRRVGRLASAGLAAGFVAIAFPPLLLVVAVSGLLWAVVARRFGAAALGLAATALGALLILPYVLGADLNDVLFAGSPPDIANEWLWLAAFGLGLAVAALFSSRTRLASIWWAGLMGSAGYLVSQIPTLAPGVAVLAMVGSSVGAAVLAASLVEVETPRLKLVGGLAAALLLLPAALTIAQGRFGLPVDRWTDRLDFVATLSAGDDPGRALLIGPPGSLPGRARTMFGFDYRTIDGGQPTLTQAYLSRPGERDEELVRVINEHLLAGVDLRPGVALAGLGIEWLVLVPDSELPTEILSRQIDLAARPVATDLAVYQNLSYRPGTDSPGESTRSELARSAGWSSGILLVVLIAAAYWGRNRGRQIPIEATVAEPVGVG